MPCLRFSRVRLRARSGAEERQAPELRGSTALPCRNRGIERATTHKTMMVFGLRRIHAGVHPLKKPFAPSCLKRFATTLPIDELPEEFMICTG